MGIKSKRVAFQFDERSLRTLEQMQVEGVPLVHLPTFGQVVRGGPDPAGQLVRAACPEEALSKAWGLAQKARHGRRVRQESRASAAGEGRGG